MRTTHARLLLALTLFSAQAHAITIDFEGVAPGTFLSPVLPYVEDVFRLTNPSGPAANAFRFDAGYTSGGVIPSTSDYLAWSENAFVLLENTVAAPFSIQSFDYRLREAQFIASPWTVAGTYSGGGTIVINVTPTTAFQTYNFSAAWTNLTSVKFQNGSTARAALDTIVLDGASVPDGGSTLMMLGLALWSVLCLRRK